MFSFEIHRCRVNGCSLCIQCILNGLWLSFYVENGNNLFLLRSVEGRANFKAYRSSSTIKLSKTLAGFAQYFKRQISFNGDSAVHAYTWILPDAGSISSTYHACHGGDNLRWSSVLCQSTTSGTHCSPCQLDKPSPPACILVGSKHFDKFDFLVQNFYSVCHKCRPRNERKWNWMCGHHWRMEKSRKARKTEREIGTEWEWKRK